MYENEASIIENIGDIYGLEILKYFILVLTNVSPIPGFLTLNLDLCYIIHDNSYKYLDYLFTIVGLYKSGKNLELLSIIYFQVPEKNLDS